MCECVSRRAGFMVSAGITALLKKMDYKDVVVAVDGSVFRFHPHFPNIVKSRIAQLMGTDYQVNLFSVNVANELIDCKFCGWTYQFLNCSF